MQMRGDTREDTTCKVSPSCTQMSQLTAFTNPEAWRADPSETTTGRVTLGIKVILPLVSKTTILKMCVPPKHISTTHLFHYTFSCRFFS